MFRRQFFPSFGGAGGILVPSAIEGELTSFEAEATSVFASEEAEATSEFPELGSIESVVNSEVGGIESEFSKLEEEETSAAGGPSSYSPDWLRITDPMRSFLSLAIFEQE